MDRRARRPGNGGLRHGVMRTRLGLTALGKRHVSAHALAVECAAVNCEDVFTKAAAMRHLAVWGGVGLMMASVMCLSACSDWTEPERDIPGRLATAAAADRPPSYFLGQSFAGLDLTTVDPPSPDPEESSPGEGFYFAYGTCKLVPDSGCSPPIQVQNEAAISSGRSVDCRGLTSIRGVPASAAAGSIIVYMGDRTVTIYPGDDPPTMGLHTLTEVMRRMAEALRPVSGPPDLTERLPPLPRDVLASVATKCAPGIATQHQ